MLALFCEIFTGAWLVQFVAGWCIDYLDSTSEQRRARRAAARRTVR